MSLPANHVMPACKDMYATLWVVKQSTRRARNRSEVGGGF